MTGTLINATAIVAGALLGATVLRRIPSQMQTTVLQGIALCTVGIGLSMALQAENWLVVIAGLALGGVIGEWLDLDGRLNRLAARLEQALRFGPGQFARGFTTATLVYCVGAMAINGALQDGLTGRYDILLVKTALDGTTSIFFSAALGYGVAFSALPVLLFQGSVSLSASIIQPWLKPAAIEAMMATGGLLILAIGLNLLEATRIKVVNLLPALVWAAVFGAVFIGAAG